MRALVCRKLGSAEDLVIEHRDDPKPGAEEVLVELHAAALNFPDTLIVSGNYQFRPDLPFIPGSEGAGVIRAVGDRVVGFKPGDRVITAGMIGSFCELQCKPVSEVFAMPDDMSFEIGAGFLVTYATSYYALKHCANLQPGETLAVLGAAGGVGLAAVDIGRALGATVIAAASSEEKLDTACSLGAQQRINYSKQSLKDELKSLTGGKGADVVYDPVGGELSEQALRATAWNGRFLVIGFASGTIPKIPLNLVLLKNNAVKGVFYGAWTQREPQAYRQSINELFQMFSSGQLHPMVSKVFTLDQYAEAFAMLSGRRAQGKICFTLKA